MNYLNPVFYFRSSYYAFFFKFTAYSNWVLSTLDLALQYNAARGNSHFWKSFILFIRFRSASKYAVMLFLQVDFHFSFSKT